MKLLPAWYPRILIIANVVLVVGLSLWAVDAYVRWRVGQGVSAYHNGVIVPMTTPRPAPAAPRSEVTP